MKETPNHFWPFVNKKISSSGIPNSITYEDKDYNDLMKSRKLLRFSLEILIPPNKIVNNKLSPPQITCNPDYEVHL